MQRCIALEIKDSGMVDLIEAICPEITQGFTFEELRGQFFMIGFPKPGEFALVPGDSVKRHWDHTEVGPFVFFKKVVR